MAYSILFYMNGDPTVFFWNNMQAVFLIGALS